MRKFIRTHSFEGVEARYGNAFIVANQYYHSLKLFGELFAEAQKSFPELSEADVECVTVIESGSCKGCPVLRFSCKADIVVDGWTSCESLPDIEVR